MEEVGAQRPRHQHGLVTIRLSVGPSWTFQDHLLLVSTVQNQVPLRAHGAKGVGDGTPNMREAWHLIPAQACSTTQREPDHL